MSFFYINFWKSLLFLNLATLPSPDVLLLEPFCCSRLFRDISLPVAFMFCWESLFWSFYFKSWSSSESSSFSGSILSFYAASSSCSTSIEMSSSKFGSLTKPGICFNYCWTTFSGSKSATSETFKPSCFLLAASEKLLRKVYYLCCSVTSSGSWSNWELVIV